MEGCYKLVCKLCQFTLNQSLYVINLDTHKVTTYTAEVNDCIDKISDLINIYHIYSITLMGAKDFTQKIKQDLIQKNLDKYTNNIISIELV